MKPPFKPCIKKVKIVWRSKDKVFIRNDISDTDHIVISNIPTPVEGMLLQTPAQLKKQNNLKKDDKRDNQ